MQLINNLSMHLANHETLIKRSMNRVIDSGWLVLGPEVQCFEQKFARYLNVKHCVSVANGTDAIELGLKALEVGQGDLVATVANAGMYSSSAIMACGASPLFMDVEFGSRLVEFASVECAVKSGVKAIVLTHLYGLAIPEIKAITELCRSAGVAVLEDCAQAHGAKIDGQCVGSFGDIASFSFYPTKNLGALGDGGAVVTNSDALASKVSALRQYGWTEKYQSEVANGRNSRLDELQAAVLGDLLPLLDGWNSQRREIAAKYSENIRHDHITLPEIASGPNYVGHLYVICSEHRFSLAQHLKACEIVADVHYPIPDHRQKAFGSKYSRITLRETERLAKQVLTLPCYPEMTEENMSDIINAVNKWVL